MKDAELELIFRAFGFGANQGAFSELKTRITAEIIAAHKPSLTDIEAILYGQSGLLPDIPVDGYSAELLYRYTNFRYKYNLEPMFAVQWKFMRIRPSDFPTIRIAQLAMYLVRGTVSSPKPHSEYWQDHIRFGVYANKNWNTIPFTVIDALSVNANPAPACIELPVDPILSYTELLELLKKSRETMVSLARYTAGGECAHPDFIAEIDCAIDKYTKK